MKTLGLTVEQMNVNTAEAAEPLQPSHKEVYTVGAGRDFGTSRVIKMDLLLVFLQQILSFAWSIVMWLPKRLGLIKEKQKEAEHEGIEWLKSYRHQLEEQLRRETRGAKRQALEEEIDAVNCAERGYHRCMIERLLSRAKMPAYPKLVTAGRVV